MAFVVDVRFSLYCNACKLSSYFLVPQLIYYCPYCNCEIDVSVVSEEKIVERENMIIDSIIKELENGKIK